MSPESFHETVTVAKAQTPKRIHQRNHATGPHSTLRKVGNDWRIQVFSMLLRVAHEKLQGYGPFGVCSKCKHPKHLNPQTPKPLTLQPLTQTSEPIVQALVLRFQGICKEDILRNGSGKLHQKVKSCHTLNLKPSSPE